MERWLRDWGSWLGGFFRYFDVLLDRLDELFVVEGPCCHDYYILPYVIFIVILLDHSLRYCLHVVNGTKDGQSHDMVAVYATMRNLYGGFEWI